MTGAMQICLKELLLVFKKSTETISFQTVNYFYGQMGAGKSSIAKLIDYCLGGKLNRGNLSTALQHEFTSATLHLTINGQPLSIERPRGTESVHASWMSENEQNNLILPARKAAGIVIPDTEVEVLSDLVFYLAGMSPVRVRRSRLRDDSEIARLSLRDLLWYCYLDQDSMDSTFFHLDSENFSKKYKSRNVLRFIVGFHQEKVAELESELQSVHENRLRFQTSAISLEEALASANVASEEDIVSRVEELEQELSQIDDEITHLRDLHLNGNAPHGADQLRKRARLLGYEIEALDNAIPEVGRAIDQDQRHTNEILMLGLKVQRAAAARAVLGGVVFEACPRCAQPLPQHTIHDCPVCGQEEPSEGISNVNTEMLEQDAKGRVLELEESVQRHKTQLRRMERRRNELLSEKQDVDTNISRLMDQYDSAYLSAALVVERRRAEIGQQITDLSRLIQLPRKVQEFYKKADELIAPESDIRRRLEEARKAAEADRSNVIILEKLFLDCLVRAHLPGIKSEDAVHINAPTFLPEVTEPESGDLTVTSFANLSSGGEKTLFKACFALAVHRLAAKSDIVLPTFLIIDSSMKNISERANKEQFENFHQLVYELAEGELSEIQMILIDKEYCAPSSEQDLDLYVRYMTPDDENHPPLIPYYRGL